MITVKTVAFCKKLYFLQKKQEKEPGFKVF